jgi:PAS domain S-box-containing protein
MQKDVYNYKILVAEDNQGDYTLFQDYLGDFILDPTLIHTKSFRETKNEIVFHKDTIEIIFLDLTLPDLKPLDLIKEVIALAGNIPIVVLTGYSDFALATESIALGISDYLLKDELNSTILYKSIVYNLERNKIITRLKVSEQRYSDLFQLSPEPMWVLDLEQLKIIDVNKAALRQYGYTKEEFLSLKYYGLQPEEDHLHTSDILQKVLAENNDAMALGVVRHQKKNGEMMYVEVRSNRIDHENRKMAVILASDYTARVKSQMALEAQNEKLREIAWTQSHVVRAPLARMMGIINLLKDNNIQEDELQLFLDHLKNSADQFDQIIREITSKAELIEMEKISNYQPTIL